MLSESKYFVAFDRLPIVSEEDSLHLGFRLMSEAGVGAVVIRTAQNRFCYVPGQWLAGVYNNLALNAEDGAASMPEISFRPLVPGSRVASYRKFLHTLRDKEGGKSKPMMIGHASDIDNPRPLKNGIDTVILVNNAQGQPLGWFFSSETILETLLTNPPVFTCENGHENPDPDGGRCYQCPGRIVPTDQARLVPTDQVQS